MMKKIIIVIVAIIVSSGAACGQKMRRNADSLLYLAVEASHLGNVFTEDYWKSGDLSNVTIGYSVKFGFDFKQRWAAYCLGGFNYWLADSEVFMKCRPQVELGLGAACKLLSKDRKLFYEPDIAVSSAVLKHSAPYLNTRFSFKIGADAFRYKPYIGISVGYIYPYNRQTISGSPMLGISLGMRLL